jgi:hypothetical protein
MYGTTVGSVGPVRVCVSGVPEARAARSLAGRRPSAQDDGDLRRLPVAEDVQPYRGPRPVLARDQVEGMRGVERRAVDRGDDVDRPGGRPVGGPPATMESCAAAGPEACRAVRPWPKPPWPFGSWGYRPGRAVALVAAAEARRDPGAVVDREVVRLLTVGSMVSKRMPRYGRASGWPRDACASSGLAMSIGIAKPMPCAGRRRRC